MNKMKKTSMNKITILNIVSSFVLQGIGFITTPIFTRLLGTAQYGLYALFNSWVLILTCVMGCSMASSIGTGLYTFKDRYLSFRNSILLFSTVICFVEFLCILIFKSLLAEILGFIDDVILLIGVCAIGHYIVNFGQVSFIYEKKAWSNFILSVLVSVFSVILSVYLIHNCNDEEKYLGRVYGVSLVYVCAAVIIWVFLFSKKPTGFKREYYKYGLNLGVPIIFHTLSQQILGQSDRVMMQQFGILNSEIGIYSLFYTLSSVLATVLGALNNSWCPFYYDDLSQNLWNRLEIKCKHYIELFTIIAVGFLLVSREITYLMADSSYWNGVNVLPLLTFAVYFTFMYQFPVNFEFYHKKTKIIAMGTVGAGIVNIVLNALLIPVWGMYGAAIATAVSYLSLFFAHYFIVTNMKEYSFHLEGKKFIPALCVLGIGVTAFYLLAPWWYLRWCLGIGLGGFELYRIVKRKSIF